MGWSAGTTCWWRRSVSPAYPAQPAGVACNALPGPPHTCTAGMAPRHVLPCPKHVLRGQHGSPRCAAQPTARCCCDELLCARCRAADPATSAFLPPRSLVSKDSIEGWPPSHPRQNSCLLFGQECAFARETRSRPS
eukprot:199279-Chlamydomonas_euryale.AAC.9